MYGNIKIINYVLYMYSLEEEQYILCWDNFIKRLATMNNYIIFEKVNDGDIEKLKIIDNDKNSKWKTF